LLKENGCEHEKCKNLDIREYINNMDVCLAAADLVICRCGAITLTEIQIMGKASVLIPSPTVAENHQFHNAMALVKENAASVIEEKDLNSQRLSEEINSILGDKKRLEEYENNARNMAITDANERIYNVIIKVLEKKN